MQCKPVIDQGPQAPQASSHYGTTTRPRIGDSSAWNGSQVTRPGMGTQEAEK